MHVDRLIEDKLTIERLDQIIITITKHNWKKKSMGPTNLYALSHQGGSLHASSKNSDVRGLEFIIIKAEKMHRRS